MLERKLGIIESKVIQQDKSTDLKGMTSLIDESKEALNLHMKQLSETLKQEIKENSNQGSEVSLLMEEISNKNNRIEDLQKKTKDLPRLQNTNQSILRENETLREKISQMGNEIDSLARENSKHQQNINALNSEVGELVARSRLLESKLSGVEEMNSMLKEQANRHEQQLLAKDKMLYMMIEEGRVKAAKDTSSELKEEEATQEILLVGDSIIKLVDTSKLLSLNQEIKISKETIYTWNETDEKLTKGHLDIPNTIIYHLGTNDIKNGTTPDEIVAKIEEVIGKTLKKNPEAKVILSAVAPRGDNDDLDMARQELNLMMLKKYKDKEHVLVVDNNNLSSRGAIIKNYYGQDLIHLTLQGAKILATNISHLLKKMLNISSLYEQKDRGGAESKKDRSPERNQFHGRWNWGKASWRSTRGKT